MSKTPYVIAGLGLGACVVLSMMMQHLLEVKKDHDRPAVAIEVEQVLGNRLVGPAVLVEKVEGDTTLLELRLKVLAGLNKEKLARSAGNLVWLRRDGEDGPDMVTVVVRDQDDEKETFDIPRPFRSRSSRWSPVQAPPQQQETRTPATRPSAKPQATDPAPPKGQR